MKTTSSTVLAAAVPSPRYYPDPDMMMGRIYLQANGVTISFRRRIKWGQAVKWPLRLNIAALLKQQQYSALSGVPEYV